MCSEACEKGNYQRSRRRGMGFYGKASSRYTLLLNASENANFKFKRDRHSKLIDAESRLLPFCRSVAAWFELVYWLPGIEGWHLNVWGTWSHSNPILIWTTNFI